MSGTPSRLVDPHTRVWELKQRLEKCWDRPINWDLYPEHLKEVKLQFSMCEKIMQICKRKKLTSKKFKHSQCGNIIISYWHFKHYTVQFTHCD